LFSLSLKQFNNSLWVNNLEKYHWHCSRCVDLAFFWGLQTGVCSTTKLGLY